jgi:hypothetical protein
MAKGGFDPIAIVPIVSNITIGTAANVVTNIKSSSVAAVKFIVVAPPASKCYLGNSSVSSTKGIPIAAGATLTLDSFYPTGQNKPISYDLGRWYLICTTASQVATVVIYGKTTFRHYN